MGWKRTLTIFLRLASALGGLGLGVWLSQPPEIQAGKGATWASVGKACGVSAAEVRRVNPGVRLAEGVVVRLPQPRWRCWLRAWGVERAFAELLATPTPVARRSVPKATPTPSEVSVEAAMRAALGEINDERAKEGRQPLAWDEGLAGIAKARAEDMIARHYYSHNDPATGRYALEGTGLGEVILKVRWSQASPAVVRDLLLRQVPDSWLYRSPPHRAPLLDPRVRRLGMGAACGRWLERSVCIAVGVLAPRALFLSRSSGGSG